MTVGDGIFYSVLLLSFVALYIATRDRWNWRKIGFRLFGGVIGILVIGGGAVYLYYIYEELPRKETSFWGIQLGISKSDVRFLKGNPSEAKIRDLSRPTYGDLLELRRWVESKRTWDRNGSSDSQGDGYVMDPLDQFLPAERTEPYLSGQLPGSHEDVWSFYLNEKSESEGVYVVSFKGGKVDAVQYIGPPLNAASIQGISGYGDYATIKERFGEPTLISRSEDDTARMLSYAQYNLVFVLRRSAIESLGYLTALEDRESSLKMRRNSERFYEVTHDGIVFWNVKFAK